MTWKDFIAAAIYSPLIIVQFILTFFFYQNWYEYDILVYAGLVLWFLSACLGIAPIIIFKRRGGVPKGKGYVHTTKLVTNGLYGGWVSSVAVDPEDPDVAYCTYSNYGIPHVLRTLNGGANWTSIDGIEAAGVPDIPAHWIAVRPCDPQQLYVGTELGVFASDDGGANWDPVNDSLAHTVVETLDFKNSQTLVAFTHGRGTFVTDLEPCPSCFVRDGDLNRDGAVDPADFAVLAGCISGPDLDERPPFCDPCDFSNADLDGDDDVDLQDFGTFAELFQGG